MALNACCLGYDRMVGPHPGAPLFGMNPPLISRVSVISLMMCIPGTFSPQIHLSGRKGTAHDPTPS